jgi:nitrite reductase/ring-hydroxylating ferredoxin subunit
MSRTPLPSSPNGWFQVAFDHELPRGAVRAVRAFGQRLVLFRGADGEARALDAYCPHLGADLGAGGRVLSGTIECPFHGWRFDGDGRCVAIPGAQRIPPAARLRSWPIAELNGGICVYHHAEGREPADPPPAVPECESQEWHSPMRAQFHIRAHIQDFVENVVDAAHFSRVHSYDPASTLTFEPRGATFVVHLESARRFLGREVRSDLRIHYFGPSYAVSRVSKPLEMVVIGSVLPVDDETIEYRASFILKRGRLRALDAILKRIVYRQACAEIRNDIPIWENKRYWEHPVLASNDGPVMKFRSWYRQFYPSSAAAAAEVASERVR